MKLVELSVRQPISITVAVLFTFLAGLVAVRLVAVEMTPEVEDTIIAVTTHWENASPQEIESEVIDPQEEKLQSLSNLRSMTSESSQSQGLIRLEFNGGIDKNIALRDVSDKLREVSSYPFGVDEPVIEASDPESQDYIAWYILQTDDESFDIRKLQTFANDFIKPILERVPGVSEVNALGGIEREVQIKVDTEKLAHYGITLSQFTQKLQASNTNASAGALSLGRLDIRLRSVGRFNSPESVKNLVLKNDTQAGLVKVGDVSEIIEDYKEATSFVRASGRRAIAFNFQREPGSNVLEIMKLLKARINEFNEPGQLLETEAKRLGLDGTLKMKLSYDATRYVSQALIQVENNIYIGGSLAIIMLLLFLRSIRSLAIIAISIPVSMIGAIILMVSLGRTVNVISLAGMAFAVGMVVDNSIVVLENIYRHLEMGKKKFQAAIDGTSEVAGAVLASSLTTMIVFIPILLITDQVGQLFRDISLAIMTAVAFSYIVAVTVIPAAGAKILNHKKYENKNLNTEKVSLYESFIRGLLKYSIIKIIVVVLMACGSIIGAYYLMPPMDYLPKGNRNIAFGLILPPPGQSIDQLEKMGKRVEAQIRPYWEDQDDRKPLRDFQTGREVHPSALTEYFLVARGGIMFHGGISSEDKQAVDNVILMQHATRQDILPGTYGLAFQLPLFRLGGSTGSAVKINMAGRDLDQVSNAAGALFGTLMGKYGPGTVRPDPSNFNLKVQEVQLRYDESTIVKAGLTRRDVVLAMQAAGDGIFIGEYEFQGDLIDLKIWSDQSRKEAAISSIEDTPVSTPDGGIMRLGQLAKVVWTNAAEKIKRVGRRRAVTLEFTAPAGEPLEKVVDDLKELIAGLRQGGAIPNSVNIDIQGSAGKLLDIRNALLGDGTILGLAASSMFTSFVAVYLLMCILFQSWLRPLVIMFTVPLATFGGFLGLSLVHKWSETDPYMPIQSLDVLTLLGFVILSGVVVNNAILIVAQADVLLKEGKLSINNAIAKATQSRVRPIFMSLLTSVGGMLPLILNPGSGSELYRGLGAVVVGGMLFSTLFTLVLIPILMSFVEQIRNIGGGGSLKAATVASIFLLMGCQGIVKDTKVELTTTDFPKKFINTQTDNQIPYGWWVQHDDKFIKDLIQRATKDELNLQALQKRIEAVLALASRVKLAKYPTLGLNSSITREKIPSFRISERTNYSVGLNLDYTVDWLGRIKDEQKIRNSEVAIAKEKRNAHKLLLVENILSHYYSYRLIQQSIQIAEKEQKLLDERLNQVHERVKRGLSQSDQLHRAQLSISKTEQLIEQLNILLTLERLALERWVGAKENSLSFLSKSSSDIHFKEFNLGTPNDLLYNRADLRIAALNVIAKGAALDLSRKEIYPKLNLGASFSFYGESFGNWINSNNSGHNYGPSLSWRLLEFGRLKQEKKAAMAEYDEAVLKWKLNVREALLKVSTNIQHLELAKADLNKENEMQVELSKINQRQLNLFKHGRIDRIKAIGTELEVLAQERQVLQAKLNKVLAQIKLYKSLGVDLGKKPLEVSAK